MSAFAVVFAGGGCRAFWALGVFERLREVLPPVDEWAGVSAGSAMALSAALQRSDLVIHEFCARTSMNPSNIHWNNIFRGKRPFPQEAIYRETIGATLGENAVEELRSVSPVRILVAEVEGPYRVWRVLSAMRSYQRRRKIGGIHGPVDLPIGLHEVIITAQELPSNGHITDAILASSASPPITRVQSGVTGPLLDGSLVDNVPVRALQLVTQKAGTSDRTLVLLNRPMPSLPETPEVMYLAPKRPVPVRKWDYTSPQKIQATVDSGRTAAEECIDVVRAWLGA